MKRLVQKFLVSILIVVLVSNFIFAMDGSKVYAEGEFSAGATLSNLATGLIGILLYPQTLLPTAILIGVSDIIGALAKVSLGDIASYGGSLVDAVIITPFHILFNKVPLLDVNFFNFDGVSGTILIFRQAVAGWYYTMRLIAAMVLAVILVYIGIRMALSTLASEKVLYKKMLVDWGISLALLFLLHYIMIFVFSCNEALVAAMEAIAVDGETKIDTMMSTIQALCFHYDIVIRIVALIIYGMLIFQTISFLISYIKRMFTIGFLIVISPLITITYSMDKIGDGKAQALNIWLKEFIYNILIQPFQCILYLVFAKLTYDLMAGQTFEFFTTSNVGTSIFAILSLQFIKEGEKIIKKIFGFDKASSLTDMAAGAAMTYAAINKGKDVAKKYGGNVAKLKNTIGTSKAMKTLKDGLKNSAPVKAATKASEKMHTKANNLKESVAKKFTSSEKLSKRREERNQSREQKLNDKVDAIAQERWNARGHTGEPSEKFKESIRNELKSKSEKKKKITGFVGGAAKTVGQASGQAISGMSAFLKDNKKSIVGASIGMFTAGIGLAAGDFGDMSKAVAGYGMGSGFMEGFYQNSAKELKEQSEAASQLYANMTGVTDANEQLANAQVTGDNDLGKDIKESLKKLNDILKNMENKDRMIGNFNNMALDKKTAGYLTRDSISQMLDANGFEGSDTEKEKIVDTFANHGKLLATQTLYTNIQSAAGMGIDREALAGIIGDRELSATQIEETIITESEYRDMPISELAEHINSRMPTNTEFTTVQNLEETNRKIDELNNLIQSLESSNESKRAEIMNAVTQNNRNIKSYDELVDGLNSQIEALKSKRNDFQR